jgi:hypothetical protein
MNIEQGIHQWWVGYKPLTDLVPVERVVTGVSSTSPGYPYVSLERNGETAIQNTSHSVIETANMVFHIHDNSDNHDRAKAVADAIFDRFDKFKLSLVDFSIIGGKHTSQPETRDPGGVWHVKATYKVIATKAR